MRCAVQFKYCLKMWGFLLLSGVDTVQHLTYHPREVQNEMLLNIYQKDQDSFFIAGLRYKTYNAYLYCNTSKNIL